MSTCQWLEARVSGGGGIFFVSVAHFMYGVDLETRERLGVIIIL